MDPRAAHLARVANGHKSSNSSFDMDRAEGGQALVSSELHERLAAHGLADQDTLQEMWHFNIWSVADLAGVDTEVLVQGGLKRFRVSKLKAIADGRLNPQSSSSARPPTSSSSSMEPTSTAFDQPPRRGAPPPGASWHHGNGGGGYASADPHEPSSGGGHPSRSSLPPFRADEYGMHASDDSAYQRSSKEAGSFAQAPGGLYPPPPPSSNNSFAQRPMHGHGGGNGSFSSQPGGDSFYDPGANQRGSGGGGGPKGSDATSALQAVQGMWQLFDGSSRGGNGSNGSSEGENGRAQPPRVGGSGGSGNNGRSNSSSSAPPSNPLLARQSSTASSTSSSSYMPPPSGGGSFGGASSNAPISGGLSTRMVRHSTSHPTSSKSREVMARQLEESLVESAEDDGVDPEDLMRLANRLIAQRQFEAALPYSLRAARRFERRNGRHDHDTMLAVMLAAKLLRRLGHHERATEYFNTLLSIQEKVLGTEHAEVANTASALGLLYAQQNTPGYDLARAVTCFEQVLEIREALQASESVDGSGGGGGGAGCAAAYHHLGVLHTDLGVAASDVDAAKDQFNEALAHFMKALKIRRSLGDAAERETASTLNNMAAVLHQLGKNEQCLSVYSKSLEIKRKLLLSTHPSIADTLYNMGALNLEMNRPGPASEYFVQALTISTTKLGMSHPLTADLQKQILTCDSLAAQQEGGGDSSSGHQDVRGGGGGAESLGLMGKDSLSSRLRLDRGLFASEYNRDRASSSGDGSANTVMFPPSMTPPSGGNTPNSGGSDTPKMDHNGKPKRSLTGHALSVLATPPMSPLTRFD